MDIVVKTILNNNYNRTRILFQRLYKQSCYASKRNYFLFNNEFRGSLGRYFLPSNRHESSAINTVVLSDIEKHDISPAEHKVIHEYLQSSIYYNKTLMMPLKVMPTVTPEEVKELYTKDWANQTAQDILNDIKKLAYCHLCGSCFEKSLLTTLLIELTPKLPELGNEQIKILMQHLIAFNSLLKTYDKFAIDKFLKALDKECINRFFRSNIQEIFMIIDGFYQLQVYDSSFLWRAIRKLGSKCYSLSAKQIVQLLFVSYLSGNSNINMFEIECRLEECVEDLTAVEMGIIARGFFLCRKPIKNKNLLLAMITKVTACTSTVDSITIALIMKILRYSESQTFTPNIQKLLQALQAEIPRLSLRCLTHITHAFGGLRIYNEELLNSILDRAVKEIKYARSKDIERIIYGICAVTPFTNYYTDICHKLINEIMMTYKTDRFIEIHKFPSSFVRTLSFLTIKNVYVPELIKFAFEPSFIQRTYKNNLKLLTDEYLSLHCSIQIDLPYYTGPLLSEKLYKYLTQKFSFCDDVRTKSNNVILRTEIVYLCKNKLGFPVSIDYTLPHYPSKDIILGLDEHNNPVDVEPILSAMPAATIKNVNNRELQKIKWKVILGLTCRVTVLGHDGYIGSVHKKLRQLRTIGYTPIVIVEDKWNFYKTEEEKTDYLRQLIFGEANHNS